MSGMSTEVKAGIMAGALAQGERRLANASGFLGKTFDVGAFCRQLHASLSALDPDATDKAIDQMHAHVEAIEAEFVAWHSAKIAAAVAG